MLLTPTQTWRVFLFRCTSMRTDSESSARLLCHVLLSKENSGCSVALRSSWKNSEQWNTNLSLSLFLSGFMDLLLVELVPLLVQSFLFSSFYRVYKCPLLFLTQQIFNFYYPFLFKLLTNQVLHVQNIEYFEKIFWRFFFLFFLWLASFYFSILFYQLFCLFLIIFIQLNVVCTAT